MAQPETSSSAGVDRLSTLTPELLHDIFSLAHKTEKPAAPLSRSLRPFCDAVKFCEVVARGGRRIHSLLESVTARPELGSLVHKIDLVDHDRFTQLGMADVQALFASFPDVRELSITAGDPSWLEVILPTRDGAQTALQESAKAFSVVGSKSHGGGYDSNVLATLKRLPNLNEILLDFPDGTSNQADPGMAKFSLPAIEHLHLASGATCDFSPALAGVKSREGVKQVWLEGYPPLGWRFPKELAAFSALETLSLKGSFGGITLEAYGRLQGVSITTLKVNMGCDISAEALNALLGPQALHGVIVKGSTVVAREIELVHRDLKEVIYRMMEEEEEQEEEQEEQEEAAAVEEIGGNLGVRLGAPWDIRLRRSSDYPDDEDEDGD
ncbi:hypothetical protein RHOSPDRAFT_30870 [Rhodotorula sp. JG-1b]|nr:hypothetical protein RHOSPDRAFT_30870 [Rhodotorula sp. JG-1b]